jgi:hypothetical protein
VWCIPGIPCSVIAYSFPNSKSNSQHAFACGSDPRPRRFWLHTCTKDHAAALPNYLKAGFTIYKEGLHEDDM